MEIFSNIEESRIKHTKRLRILNAAYEAFVQNGIESISMLDIAQRSGMQRRNLYNYYEDKEQIAVALMECWYREIERFGAPGETADTALELIRLRLDRFYEFAMGDPQALIYSVHFDHYFRSHVDSCRFAEYQSLTVPIFLQENLIERGLEDGSLRPGLWENAALLNSVLQSAVLAYTQKALFYQDTAAAQKQREQELRLFLDFLVQAVAAG